MEEKCMRSRTHKYFISRKERKVRVIFHHRKYINNPSTFAQQMFVIVT